VPVLRVDDDVWRWLQSLARPFEDTPNSVLRRIARLDSVTSKEGDDQSPSEPPNQREVPLPEQSPTRNRKTIGVRVTGEQLNRKYRLGARHALYHKDGTFYERLTRFPGVLCDPRGYVRYDTAQQFEKDSQLSIGDKVNIHRTLASHPRYKRFVNAT
jgi:hypothetical protein